MGVIAATLFKLFSRVPWWVWVAAGVAMWGWSGHARYGALKKDVVTQVAKSEKEQRDEEQRRAVQHAKVLDKAVADREQSRLAAERARAAEQRLRQRLDAEQARARRETGDNPAAAAGWAAAETIGKVLGHCVTRYRELGEEADRARDAGIACERAYDALSPSAERPEPVTQGEENAGER